MNGGALASSHDQATISAISALRESRNGAPDLAGIPHIDRAQLHAQRWRHGLDCRELAWSGRHGGITKNRRPRYAGSDQLEQLQPFSAHRIFVDAEACRVSAWPREIVNIAGPYRVNNNVEHYRNGPGRLQHCRDSQAGTRQDDVRGEVDQFRREFAQKVGAHVAPADLDLRVAPFDPAQVYQ